MLRIHSTVLKHHLRRCVVAECVGGYSVRETPGPIPNPEAKPDSADGTATEGLWESRTPPNLFWRKGLGPVETQVSRPGPFLHSHPRSCWPANHTTGTVMPRQSRLMPGQSHAMPPGSHVMPQTEPGRAGGRRRNGDDNTSDVVVSPYRWTFSTSSSS